MAEQGNEKMTEWLDIHLDSLSSEERIRLIEEVCNTLTPQELLTIRNLAEKQRLITRCKFWSSPQPIEKL